MGEPKADEAGGRWDVGAKDNTVFLERRDEDDERIFSAKLAPDEARELAALLTKFADKTDSPGNGDSDEGGSDDSPDDS